MPGGNVVKEGIAGECFFAKGQSSDGCEVGVTSECSNAESQSSDGSEACRAATAACDGVTKAEASVRGDGRGPRRSGSATARD